MSSIDVEIICFSRKFFDIDITNFEDLKEELAKQNKIDGKTSIRYWWHQIPSIVNYRWQSLLQRTKGSNCLPQLGKALKVLAVTDKKGGWIEAIELIEREYIFLSEALGFNVNAKNEL